jgi:hypothetical protein
LRQNSFFRNALGFEFKHEPLDPFTASSLSPRDFLVSTLPDRPAKRPADEQVWDGGTLTINRPPFIISIRFADSLFDLLRLKGLYG